MRASTLYCFFFLLSVFAFAQNDKMHEQKGRKNYTPTVLPAELQNKDVQNNESSDENETPVNTERFQKLKKGDDRNSVNARGVNPSVLAPANDLCSGAIALTSGVLTAGTSTAATFSSSDPVPTCAIWFFGYWYDHTVWYKITIGASSTLNVVLASTGIQWSGVTVYQGACGAFSQIKCKEASTSGGGINTTTSCLPAGTYYIMVFDDLGSAGNFNITVTATACVTSNGACGSAYAIASTDMDGTWIPGFTSAGHTTDGTTDPYGYSCFTRNEWYSFVAQGPNIEITVSGVSCMDPEIHLYSTNPCAGAGTEIGVATYQACAFGGPTYSTISLMNNDPSQAAPFYFTLTIGQTYWFSVSSNNAAGCTGSYSVNVNNPAGTNAPPGTNCINGTTICANGLYAGAADLWGDQELTTSTIEGCNLAGEINSSWFYLNVQTGGSLTFTISPINGTDDYDFALYTGNSCSLGAPTTCNFSSTTPNTGVSSAAGGTGTSIPSTGIPWNANLAVTSGQVYIMYINGYTPSSGNYNFTFGGTAVLGCTTPTILSVKLLSFTASQKGKNVELNWVTTNEENNSHFIIERSGDGKNFELIAKVRGANNSSQNKNYQTTDREPLTGTSYYRLSQVDLNGRITSLSIVEIDKAKNYSIDVYPNPSNENFSLDFNAPIGSEVQVDLRGTSGNLVDSKLYTGTGLMQHEVIESLSPGIYFLNIKIGSEIIHKKLIKY